MLAIIGNVIALSQFTPGDDYVEHSIFNFRFKFRSIGARHIILVFTGEGIAIRLELNCDIVLYTYSLLHDKSHSCLILVPPRERHGFMSVHTRMKDDTMQLPAASNPV
jgi:hypothetical protein